MGAANVQGPAVPTTTGDGLRDMIRELTRGTDVLGPLAIPARKVLRALTDGIDMIQKGGDYQVRKVRKDLRIVQLRRTGAAVPGELLDEVAKAARDSFAQRAKAEAEELANDFVEVTVALKNEIDKIEAASLGPAALRPEARNRDLASLLRVASVREEVGARPMPETLDLLCGYIARGDDDAATMLADAVGPVAEQVLRMDERSLAKRVGPTSGSTHALHAVRSGDLDKERSAALGVVNAIAEMRAKNVPPYVEAARLLYRRCLDLSANIYSFNAWMMKPEEVGTSGPRLTWDWKAEPSISPDWSYRLLCPFVRGQRPPWTPVASLLGGPK